jgi:hypothetical protein
MKRKWHRVENLTNKEIIENLPLHVWGLRAGLHYSTFFTAAGFKCEDGEFYDNISHICPFPQVPRKRSL